MQHGERAPKKRSSGGAAIGLASAFGRIKRVRPELTWDGFYDLTSEQLELWLFVADELEDERAKRTAYEIAIAVKKTFFGK